MFSKVATEIMKRWPNGDSTIRCLTSLRNIIIQRQTNIGIPISRIIIRSNDSRIAIIFDAQGRAIGGAKVYAPRLGDFDRNIANHRKALAKQGTAPG
jgi:hypothetical protein